MRQLKFIFFATFFYSIFITTVLSQGFSAPSVYVVKAQMKNLSPVLWLTGTTVSANDSQIAAEVSGRLITLVELGQEVKHNDIIAKIDDSQLKIQLLENKANIEKAEAQLAYQEAELKRKLLLAKKKLSALTDVDLTRSLRDVAKNDVTIAKAKLAQTKQQLAYTQLKAPFDGLVAERLSNLGEYVNNGTAIIRLVTTKNLEASVFVPITSYQYLNKQQTLAIKSPLGKVFAPIKAIIPVADSRSHLMEVRLNLSKVSWPIGLQIKVAIANGDNKKVLAVPRDALILRRNGSSIFTVNNKNIVTKVPVQLGIGVGEWVEIKGNVNPNDNVIIRGSERLRTGQKVQIKKNNQTLISSNSN